MSRAAPAHRAATTWSARRPAVFFAALVLLVGTGVGLAYAGVRTVRESTAGQRFDPTMDPADPGFEGFVEATPTVVLLHEGPDGLVGAAVLSLRGEALGGGVLLIPGGVLVDPLGDPRRLDDVFAFGGLDEAVDAVERILGIGIEEGKVVDDSRWAELVEPVAPLTVQNPDELDDFPAGRLEIGPHDVGSWLEVPGPGASDANRQLRHLLFWEAWLGAIGESDAEQPVPGEVDAGLGRFAVGLAAGPSEVALLPAREEPGDERGSAWVPEPAEVNRVVSSLVPLPTAPEPGGRVRVRLLDGTGDPDLAMRAAPLLVPAGAEIVIVGNSSAGFDHRETEVRHHDAHLEPAAEHLRDALGVGQAVLDPRPTDTYDVTVVLGADAARAFG